MSGRISDEHLLYGSSPLASTMSPTRSQLIDDNYNPQDGSSPILRNNPSTDNDYDDDNKSVIKARYLPIITRILTAILAISLIGLVFGLLPYFAVEAGKRGHINQTLYWIAGCFVLITVPISVLGIVQHLVNWYMPQVQKVSVWRNHTPLVGRRLEFLVIISFCTRRLAKFSHHVRVCFISFLLTSPYNSSSSESSS